MTNSELFASIDADSFYIDGSKIADTKAPKVPIERRWEDRRFQARLVNPANRRKLSVIIVGSGLAGSSAAATLGEAGYNVSCFCYQDSPRRAHSIAAIARRSAIRSRSVRALSPARASFAGNSPAISTRSS